MFRLDIDGKGWESPKPANAALLSGVSGRVSPEANTSVESK
jgi:hypothetical protein